MSEADSGGLSSDDVVVLGPLTDASNVTLQVRVNEVAAVYKPVAGERPLHDFPPGTLARREVAAYQIATAAGWDLIPPTILREGPLGLGSVQRWVDSSIPERSALTAFRPAEMPQDWLAVLAAEAENGDDLLIAHPDDPVLRSFAVLDVVLNNADRKASHLVHATGRGWRGIDHGLCLHAEEKLRTVLWGWAGDPLPEADRRRLEQLSSVLDHPRAPRWTELLEPDEVAAVADRVAALLDDGHHPLPPQDRYPLPWPLW